jgi:GNAT superfamily N-acetyltransferase
MTHAGVRLAERIDLNGMLALYRELRPNDPALSEAEASEIWVRILSNPDLRVVVAECDGTLASTCMLAVVSNLANGGRPFGVIEHVVTLPRMRRRGLARAVLQFALNVAWSRRCSKVMLLSGMQRGEAHKLYESVGFRGDVERGFVAKP